MDAQVRKAPIPIINVALALIFAPGFMAGQELELDLPDSVSVRRVRCIDGCSKWLAKVLVGPAAIEDTADLHLGNWGPQSISVTDALLFAKGDISELFWESTLDTLTLGRMQTGTVEIFLSPLISRGPDRYAGEVRVRAPEVEKSLSAPFRLYVRNGPGWAFFCLLLGFLGGRIVVKVKVNESDGSNTSRPDKINAFLTGVARTDDSAKRHEFRVRVGAAWVLLALAVYEGLKILYINDLTFGDNGILDYAAVFAWAAATDGGQRFLTNLKWKP